MLEQGIATAAELDRCEEEDLAAVREAQARAWQAFGTDRGATEGGPGPDRRDGPGVCRSRHRNCRRGRDRSRRAREDRTRRSAATSWPRAHERADRRRAAKDLRRRPPAARDWKRGQEPGQRATASARICTASSAERRSARARGQAASTGRTRAAVNGFEVLNACFDYALRRYPEPGRAAARTSASSATSTRASRACRTSTARCGSRDTGIRECTIVGQAIGMAMRGLRPIAEIQYLDYILYALQIMSDDLATLRWRTEGGQKAPVIVRTRGHRLEGIWHSGSPMAGIIHLVRGIYVCVPRNMTQAAGFYNTLLRSDDPAIVIEVLNGYRLKERLPANIGEFTVPLGVPEVLRRGDGRDGGHLRRALPDRAGSGGDVARCGDRRRGDRRPDPAAVRPPRAGSSNRSRRPTGCSSSTRTCPAAPPPT